MNHEQSAAGQDMAPIYPPSPCTGGGGWDIKGADKTERSSVYHQLFNRVLSSVRGEGLPPQQQGTGARSRHGIYRSTPCCRPEGTPSRGDAGPPMAVNAAPPPPPSRRRRRAKDQPPLGLGGHCQAWGTRHPEQEVLARARGDPEPPQPQSSRQRRAAAAVNSRTLHQQEADHPPPAAGSSRPRCRPACKPATRRPELEIFELRYRF